jgi:predicted nucleotide-binding protein
VKSYPNRKSQDYLQRLRELITFDFIKENAVSLRKPKIIRGKTFEKFIRIDFIGLMGSTLLDAAQMLGNENMFEEFKSLLEKFEELHEEGIFLKVRFLFEYPYSVSSLARIQAETSNYRASMSEPAYSRDFELMEQIDEDTFSSSFYVSLQKSNLRNLQEIENSLRHNPNWENKENPSSLTVRFTPIHPGVCCLIINDTLFYDPYILSKENRRSNKLSHLIPVIELNNIADSMPFAAFEDHFRYLWELDVTLDCEDATKYQPNKANSLSLIREPNNITYDAKSSRISEQKGYIFDDDKEISKWRKSVTNQLHKNCTDLLPTNANETVFITCSWEKEADGVSAPNNYAKLLATFLQEDFSPTLSVKIMDATPSEFLSKQLYSTLDSSTFGIMLMTKDIETKNGDYVCKPNVYHELGYLMKQLGKKRVLIISEKGVIMPSNVQDIIRFDFEENRISFRYLEVVQRLNKILSFPKTVVVNSLNNHLNRLTKFLHDGGIQATEFRAIETKINQYLSEVNKIVNNGVSGM